MTENMKKFLELVSQEDEAYVKKVTSLDKEGVIALAAEKGITLTDADFTQSEEEGEVSLDEADAVAGGKKCTCTGIGGGNKTKKNADGSCGCVGIGIGNDTDGDERCLCVGYGEGKACNGYCGNEYGQW